MQNENNENMKFEAGKEYGNDLTVTVLKRTGKTVTIETVAWGVTRVKVRTNPNGLEYISFKAWLINATDCFDAEESKQIFFEKAYS